MKTLQLVLLLPIVSVFIFSISFHAVLFSSHSISSHPAQLFSPPQEGSQSQCDPLDHVDTCLSPSPTFLTKRLENQQPRSECKKKNFFNFSQLSIDRFSNELSEPASSVLPNQAHLDQGPENLKGSPLEDLSPVYEKSDIEGNEKSLSDLIQSPLSESAEASDLQKDAINTEQSSGETLPESPRAPGQGFIPMLKEGCPGDWTSSAWSDQLVQGVPEGTPELLRTPTESDYVFVDLEPVGVSNDAVKLRDVDPAASDDLHVVVEQEGVASSITVDPTSPESSGHHGDSPEKQDSSTKLHETSSPPEMLENSLMIPRELNNSESSKDETPPTSVRSGETLHPSEERRGDRGPEAFSAPGEAGSFRMQEVYETPQNPFITDNVKFQCEAQCEMVSTAQRDVSPFSVSDVSPQTPETVRDTQHFEFEEKPSDPGPINFEQISVGVSKAPSGFTKDPVRSQDSGRSLSQPSPFESPYQCPAEPSAARSLSESRPTVPTFTRDQDLALPQKLAPSETLPSGQQGVLEPARPEPSEEHEFIKPLSCRPDSETEGMEESVEDIKKCKALDGTPHVLQRVPLKPEDPEIFFECKETISDQSEPEPEINRDAAELKTRLRRASFSHDLEGEPRSSESEDFEDAPIVQEPSHSSQEDLTLLRQRSSQAFTWRPAGVSERDGFWRVRVQHDPPVLPELLILLLQTH